MTLVMKGFSLWQPWGSLWLTDRKINETRDWQTNHRGWLIVQAAMVPMKKKDFEGDRIAEICVAEFGSSWMTSLPRGAIIGAVRLTGCHSMAKFAPEHDDDLECGNWADDRFAWHRDHFFNLDTPIPWRGQQRLFDVPITKALDPLMELIPADEVHHASVR